MLKPPYFMTIFQACFCNHRKIALLASGGIDFPFFFLLSREKNQISRGNAQKNDIFHILWSKNLTIYLVWPNIFNAPPPLLKNSWIRPWNESVSSNWNREKNGAAWLRTSSRMEESMAAPCVCGSHRLSSTARSAATNRFTTLSNVFSKSTDKARCGVLGN